MLFTTLVVELVSVGLALYPLSASVYGLCHEMKSFIVSLCIAPQVYFFGFDVNSLISLLH